MLLFRTIHGSHLYGLNHSDSDIDYFEVYSNREGARHRRPQQTIVNGIDTVRMELSTFMLYADRGAHQTLEALFSPVAEVDLIHDLRRAYRVNTATFRNKFSDVIHSFMMSDSKKKLRHAVRLGWALHDGLEYGRFNPVLTPRRREFLLESSAMDLFRMADSLLVE